MGGVESRISLDVVTCGLQRGRRRCRESDLSERGYLQVLANLCALTDQCWYHYTSDTSWVSRYQLHKAPKPCRWPVCC